MILLDRVSKLLVLQYIPPEHEISVLPGLFQLSHWENTERGVQHVCRFKFGIENSRSDRICSCCHPCDWLSPLEHGAALDSTSVYYCVILGGASGNLWDRLSKATVIDFLDFYIGDHHWPPFSAIVIGAAVLIAKVLFSPNHEKARR